MVEADKETEKDVSIETKLLNIARTFGCSIICILDINLEKEAVAFLSVHDRKKWFDPSGDDDEEPSISLSKMTHSKTTRLAEDYIG